MMSSPGASSSGINPAPVAAAAPVASGYEGGEELICIRCEEPTKISESQQYGRNPFVRSCNHCCNSYRARTNAVNKEKKEGKTTLQDMWAKFNSQEKVQWYAKEKRVAYVQGKPRGVAESISAIIEERHVSKRGKKRKNDLIPFSIFFSRQQAFGKGLTEIQAEWRDMKLDPTVDREEVVIRGKTELCLEVFGGIEKYDEEVDETSSTCQKHRKIDSAQDLEEAVQEGNAELARAHDRNALTDAVLLSPKLPADEVMDLDVPKHLLPTVPVANQVLPASVSGCGVLSGVMSQLRASEKDDAAQEAQWLQEAKAFSEKQSKQAQHASKTKTLMKEKDKITIRGAVDRSIAGMKDKMATLKSEGDAVKKDAHDLDVHNKDRKVQELDAAIQAASEDFTEKEASLTRIRSSLDSAEEAVNVKDLRTQITYITSKFVEENSCYKKAKLNVGLFEKAVKAAIRKTKKDAAAPTVFSQSAQPNKSSTAVALESLSNEKIPDAVADKIKMELDKVQVIKHEDVKTLACRMLHSTYYKNQRNFLGQYMDKAGPTCTTQSVQITVKVVLRDMTNVFEPLMESGLTEPPRIVASAPKSKWATSFSKQFVVFKNHEHVGVANFCLGGVFVGLEGQFYICGVRLNKLKGTMAEQRDILKSLSPTQLKETVDFSFHFDMESKTMIDAALVIPPGFLYMMWSQGGSAIHWGWGCNETTPARVVQSSLEALFSSWPDLNAGEYKYFSERLASGV